MTVAVPGRGDLAPLGPWAEAPGHGPQQAVPGAHAERLATRFDPDLR